MDRWRERPPAAAVARRLEGTSLARMGPDAAARGCAVDTPISLNFVARCSDFVSAKPEAAIRQEALPQKGSASLLVLLYW